MALRKLNTFSLVSNDDIDAIEETLNKAYKGLHAVSLTEMDTTVQPVIAAGSVVEINGALFVADTNESISGTPADGSIYIKLIPAGSPATVTAQFTATAPVWDKEKQGWYSPTAGEENYRYLDYILRLASSKYYKTKRGENDIAAILSVSDLHSAYTYDPVPFNVISLNKGNCFNTSDYKFYLPKGRYQFNIRALFNNVIYPNVFAPWFYLKSNPTSDKISLSATGLHLAGVQHGVDVRGSVIIEISDNNEILSLFVTNNLYSSPENTPYISCYISMSKIGDV